MSRSRRPALFSLPGAGVAERHPPVVFDYPTWGLAEGLDDHPAAVFELTSEKRDAAIALLSSSQVDLTGYQLVNAAGVKHFQGQDKPIQSVALLRYERADGVNTGIGGEHISAIIHLETNRLIGLTRMQLALDGSAFVSHTQALQTAIAFLKKAAPDLMPQNTDIPAIADDKNPGERMAFSPALEVGNVEIHWVDDHKEEIGNSEVHGMKVKMFMPASELWAWVVVDKNAQVVTFERDIFWNFEAFRRETQLWLHDKWINAQTISLPPAVSDVSSVRMVL